MRHEVFCEKDGATVWFIADASIIVEGLKQPEPDLEWMDACRVRIAKYRREFVSKDMEVEQGSTRWIYGLSNHCQRTSDIVHDERGHIDLRCTRQTSRCSFANANVGS